MVENRQGRKGTERKDVKGYGEIGKAREGWEGEGRERKELRGKGEVGLDLDICPGAPEFLVTPLSEYIRCVVIFMLHPAESV